MRFAPESRRYFLGRLILVPLLGFSLVVLLAASLDWLGLLPGRWGTSITLQVWIIPALSGLVGGLVLNRRRTMFSHLFVWVLPCLFFTYVWFTYPSHEEALRYLLTSDCSTNECLAEVFVTTPAVFSIAFTLGTLLQLVRFQWATQ